MVLFHITAIGSVTARGNWNLQFWTVKGLAIIVGPNFREDELRSGCMPCFERSCLFSESGFISAVSHKTAYFQKYDFNRVEMRFITFSATHYEGIGFSAERQSKAAWFLANGI